MERKRYDAIDGLRTIACIGIVMMHMAAEGNNPYELHPVFRAFVDPLTNFVFLFMAISAFGMCCGYFEKMIAGGVDLSRFYLKRYARILPFFSVLILLDLVMGFSKESLYEAITDVSLMYGFFLHDISVINVIGVGWFLGVVFAFYMVFPFFCVLIQTKKRAWCAFAFSILLNYILKFYFGVERANFVFCLCYFILGGLVYQYRNEICAFGKSRYMLLLGAMLLSIVLYYWIGENTVIMLLVSGALLSLSVAKPTVVLQNRFTKFISSVSMEIYLSHMVVFRIIEKMKLNTILGTGMLQYCVTVLMVFAGAIVFSLVVKAGLNKGEDILKSKMSH